MLKSYNEACKRDNQNMKGKKGDFVSVLIITAVELMRINHFAIAFKQLYRINTIY